MVYSARSDAATRSQFTRRKGVTITTNGTSTPTDYQVRLTITYEPGMQADFGDIRFNTLSIGYIDYWIESYVASTSAVVWVKLPDAITDPGSDIILMYYGNPGLSNGSVGDDTFLFFDDFDGALDTSKWDTVGSPSQTGGEIICTETGQERVVSKTSFQYKKFRSRGKLTWATGAYAALLGLSETYAGEGTNTLQIYVDSTTVTKTLSGDASTLESTDIGDFDGAYHTWEIRWKSGEAKYYVDDVLEDTDSTNIPSASIPVFFENYRANAESRGDWVFVANCIADEPTPTYGTAQHQRRTPQFIG